MQLRPELVADVRRTRLLMAVGIVVCPPAVIWLFPLWVRATHRLSGREEPPYLSWMPLAAPLLIPGYLLEERSKEGALLLLSTAGLWACCACPIGAIVRSL